MADDKNEGKEVDFLIKELSARKAAALKPAGPQMTIPTPSKVSTPAPVPPIAAPGPRATNRVAAPATSSKTFVSAIRFRPAMKSMGLSPLSFDAVAMPTIALPTFSETTTVRAWVALGTALAVAMPFWPYPKAYSWGLFLYLFAVAMVIFSGVWSARLTWITRLAIAHTLAVTILVWGVTLAAAETLPRIGYAKAETTWFHP